MVNGFRLSLRRISQMRNCLRREELPGSRTSLTVMFGRLSVVLALLFCSVTASGQAQVAAQPASETPAAPVSAPIEALSRPRATVEMLFELATNVVCTENVTHEFV